MRAELTPHPDSPSTAVQSVQVELDSARGVTTLWYTVFGAIDALVLPPEVEQHRADGLWRTTCFEMFVREQAGPGYLELNFSPSTEWAAYRFDGYRSGMTPADLLHEPIISRIEAGWFDLHVTVPLDLTGARHPIQLAAIIEEKDGGKSYWALAHPPGEPDFHHPDGFALELPPAPTSSPRT